LSHAPHSHVRDRAKLINRRLETHFEIPIAINSVEVAEMPPARQHIGPALEFLDLPDCKHLRPSKFREWRGINVVMTVASIRGGSAVVPDRGAVITTSCALPRVDSKS
jgi:hypothetical protein